MEDKANLKSDLERALNEWNDLGSYSIQEEILNELFRRCGNDDFNEIVIKVTVLDSFYSTCLRFNDNTKVADKNSKSGVIEVATVINGIRNFDEKVKTSKALVNEIQEAAAQSNTIPNKIYSFATKYCSFSNPELYPIYDNYVVKMLKYFRDRDKIISFDNEDLSDYEKFVCVIDDFKKAYELQEYSYKDIDRYLWLAGKNKWHQ